MNLLESTTMLTIGVLLALWTLAAGWGLARGLSQQRRAGFVTRRAEQLAALVDLAPALPLIVRADGRLEGPGAVAPLFGLERLPDTIDGLGAAGEAGLDPRTFQLLAAEVVQAQRTGKAFRLTLTARDRRRAIAVAGAPAPETLGSGGSALLWVSDASEQAAREHRLTREREDAIEAFDALSAVIEAAPFPMWFRQEDGALALVNGAYVAASEARSADAAVGRQIELVEPVRGLSARDAALQAAGQAEPVSRVVPVTIGGERRVHEVVDVAVPGIGIAGYAIDRQSLDDALAEIARAVAARRTMLDQLSAAVAEFGPDRSLIFWNRPFLRLFLLDEGWAGSSPAFERVLDRMRDAGRAPETRDFPSWRKERLGWFALRETEEESWHLRDGTHLRAIAHPSADGGLLLLFEDRTEQTRLASARDTLVRVRNATFDNLFEAVAVFAPDGRLHLWNQRFRRLWGLNEEYLTASPRLDALLERAGQRLADPRQAAVVRQMVIGATADRQQRSGRIVMSDARQFDFATIPLPDGNALLTLIDVTDSRRIETALRERAEALEAADKVKSDFLSRVSYELRTPLTSIGGYAEMLAGGFAGELPEAAQTYVRAIMDSTEQLGTQIGTVLDLAQTEAGHMPLEARAIALPDFLADALRRVEGAAARAEVKITRDVRASVGRIDGDVARLGQAFDQLLLAALGSFADRDWQPEGGRRVLVFAEGDATQARIILSDNGPGAQPQGTLGIGVALARQLIEAHRGTFEQQYVAGEGAMLTITLPR